MVAEINLLARVASGLMALGIVGIPIGLMADWRRASKRAPTSVRKRVKATVRRGAATHSRRPAQQRKRAVRKR
jgi:hypothetical protein